MQKRGRFSFKTVKQNVHVFLRLRKKILSWTYNSFWTIHIYQLSFFPHTRCLLTRKTLITNSVNSLCTYPYPQLRLIVNINVWTLYDINASWFLRNRISLDVFSIETFLCRPTTKDFEDVANVPRLFSTANPLTSMTMEMLKTGRIIVRL